MSPSSSNLIVFTAGSSGPGTICGQVFSVPTLSDEPRANTSVLRGHCDTSLPASWSSDSTSWRTPGPSGAQDRVCVPEAALSLEACPRAGGQSQRGSARALEQGGQPPPSLCGPSSISRASARLTAGALPAALRLAGLVGLEQRSLWRSGHGAGWWRPLVKEPEQQGEGSCKVR